MEYSAKKYYGLPGTGFAEGRLTDALNGHVFQQFLRQIEHLRADDGRAAVLHVMFGNHAAVVYSKGFLKVIRVVCLLQNGTAFFASKDVLHRERTPAGGFLSFFGFSTMTSSIPSSFAI